MFVVTLCWNSTARHARHARLDSLDTWNESSRVETSQVEFGLYLTDIASDAIESAKRLILLRYSDVEQV